MMMMNDGNNNDDFDVQYLAHVPQLTELSGSNTSSPMLTLPNDMLGMTDSGTSSSGSSGSSSSSSGNIDDLLLRSLAPPQAFAEPPALSSDWSLDAMAARPQLSMLGEHAMMQSVQQQSVQQQQQQQHQVEALESDAQRANVLPFVYVPPLIRDEEDDASASASASSNLSVSSPIEQQQQQQPQRQQQHQQHQREQKNKKRKHENMQATDAAPKKKVSESAKARRRRHNEMEIKRRKLLNQSFERLQSLVQAPDPSKSNILASAIKTLNSMEERIKAMEEANRRNRERLEEQKLETMMGKQETYDAVATSGYNDLTLGQLRRAKQKATGNADVGVAGDDSTSPLEQEQQQQQQQQQQTPEQFRAFLHSGVAMSVSLMDGRIVDCNDKFEELLKNKKKNISNLSVFTITHPEFVPKSYEMHNNLISERSKVEETKKLIVNCQGEILSVHVTTWMVKEEGRPKYLMAVMVPLEVLPKNAKAYASSHANALAAAASAASSETAPSCLRSQ